MRIDETLPAIPRAKVLGGVTADGYSLQPFAHALELTKCLQSALGSTSLAKADRPALRVGRSLHPAVKYRLRDPSELPAGPALTHWGGQLIAELKCPRRGCRCSYDCQGTRSLAIGKSEGRRRSLVPLGGSPASGSVSLNSGIPAK